jgi:hypothetical protein
MHQRALKGITRGRLISRRDFAGLIPALFILAGLELLGCSRVASPTYYVNSSTGADNNDGRTARTAWQTVNKVSTVALAAGDIVAFCGGQTFTGRLVVSASGSPIAPIVFTSYGVGRATISAIDSNIATFVAVNKSHITIDGINFAGTGTSGAGVGIHFSATSGASTDIVARNIQVTGFGASAVAIGGDSGTAGFDGVTIEAFVIADNLKDGIAVYGSTSNSRSNRNITIRNGIVHNNGFNGAYIGNTDGGLIQNVVAYHNGASSNDGPVGLWTYESNAVVIRFCESYNNSSANSRDGDGFDIDDGCTNCLVEYCYAHGNKGAGFLLWNDAHELLWDNNTVRFCIGENNVNTGTFYGEVHIGADGIVSTTNAYVYNNTFYNSRPGISIVQITDSRATARLANNIFYSSGASKLATVSGTAANLVFTGNDWFATSFSIDWNSTTYTNYSEWQKGTAQEQIDRLNVGFSVDPMLYSAGNGGTVDSYNRSAPSAYKLRPSSPLLTAGIDLTKRLSIDPGAQDYYGGRSAVTHGPLEQAEEIVPWQSEAKGQHVSDLIVS